jgi:hypothetical protein
MKSQGSSFPFVTNSRLHWRRPDAAVARVRAFGTATMKVYRLN